MSETNSTKVSTERSNLELNCSCLECDSWLCFGARRKSFVAKCTCTRCENTETCLYRSNIITKVLHNIVTESTNKPDKDIVETEHSNMIKHTQDVKGNTGKPRIIINDELEEQNVKIMDGELSTTLKTIKEHSKHTIYTKDNKNNTAKIVSEKRSKFSYTSKQGSIEKVSNSQRTAIFSGGSTTEPHNIYCYPRKDVNAGAAKLSAQIMNVPYNDYNESNNSENSSYQALKLSTFEIFKRIQEAYNACTCKICECVVGKSTDFKSETCDCKPCDCEECIAALSGRAKQNYPIETNYASNISTCDCKPCECIDCTTKTHNFCDCKTCQCMECKPKTKPKRAIVVATALEEMPGIDYSCSTCEGASCGYSHSNNPTTHEVSTGIDRHPDCQCEACINEFCLPDTDSCLCNVYNSVMNKPTNRNNCDYDIRVVTVDKNRGINYNTKSRSKNDTIAMFASLSNNYKKNNVRNIINEKYETNKFTDTSVYCNDKIPHKTGPRSTDHYRGPTISGKISGQNCNCSSCECTICFNRNNNNSNNYSHDTNKLRTDIKNSIQKRICDCYDCLKRDRLDTKSEKSQEDKCTNICKCELCECIECQYIVAKCKEDICHPINCSCHRCSVLSNNTNNLDKLKIPLLSSYDKPREDRTGLFGYKVKSPNSWDMKTNSSREFSVYHMAKYDNADSSTEEYTSSYAPATTYKPNINSYKNQNMKPKLNFNKNCYKYDGSINSRFKEDGYSSNNQTFARLYFGLDFKASFSKEGQSASCNFINKKEPQSLLSWSSYYKSFQESSQFRTNSNKPTVENCLNNILQTSSEKKINLDRFEISAPIIIEEKHKSPSSLLWTDSNKILGAKKVEVEIDNKIKKCENINSSYSDLNNYCYIKKPRNAVTLNNNIENYTKMSREEIYDQCDNDFLRVQNTLRKAREFSFRLINILLKYEKANNNFISISDRLKSEQTSKFIGASKIIKDDIFDFKKLKLNVTNLHSFPTDNKLTLLRLMTDNRFDYETHENDDLTEHKKHNVNQKKTLLDSEGHKKYKKLIKKAFSKIRQHKLRKHSNINNALVDAQKSLSETNNKVKYNQDDKESQTDKINTSQKQINKMFENIIEKIIDLVEETKIDVNKHPLQANINQVNILQYSNKQPIDLTGKEHLNMINQTNLLPIFSNCEEVHNVQPIKCEVEEKTRQNNTSLSKTEQKHKDDLPQSSCSNKDIKDHHGAHSMCTIKHCIKDIASLPTIAEIKKQYNLENRLLETNISTEQRIISMNNQKSNCEETKVNFFGLRRVSDHTVLVRWNTPKNMTDVLGFELSVDGRAVQKIFSPSRRMALITCLPNKEKVLLSIRRITAIDTGHFPPTSIVYRPRLK